MPSRVFFPRKKIFGKRNALIVSRLMVHIVYSIAYFPPESNSLGKNKIKRKNLQSAIDKKRKIWYN